MGARKLGCTAVPECVGAREAGVPNWTPGPQDLKPTDPKDLMDPTGTRSAAALGHLSVPMAPQGPYRYRPHLEYDFVSYGHRHAHD